MTYTVEHAKIIDIPELLETTVLFWNESDKYIKTDQHIEG